MLAWPRLYGCMAGSPAFKAHTFFSPAPLPPTMLNFLQQISYLLYEVVIFLIDTSSSSYQNPQVHYIFTHFSLYILSRSLAKASFF